MDVTVRLAAIEEWLRVAASPDSLGTNDEFMDVLVEAMNRTLVLLRVAVELTPGAGSALGVTRYRAVPLGLMVRLVKLFEGLLLTVCSGKLELTGLYQRPLYETNVKLHYLLEAKNRGAAIRSYIETSYRDALPRVRDLRAKKAVRPLQPIEKRMLAGILRDMKQDRITVRMLEARKNWELDGKNFKAILAAVGREAEYKWLYGPASRFQHGSWSEVRMYHLQRNGGRFSPRLRFAAVDPRAAAPLTILCLSSAVRYLRWAHGKNWKRAVASASVLDGYVRALDAKHEETWARNFG
jgi:hypothetical protein